jgi:peptidoglycan/LPS O-acetylase OafA/YrhL
MRVQQNKNSFDLLRLVAATMVIVSHQFQLLGRPQPRVFGVTSLGFFGVLVFLD